MSLIDWSKNGWLRAHQSSPVEISNLLKIVDRDLADASVTDVSDDWRFGIAYNAALKLCTIVLYSSGFRPEKNLAHFRSIYSLPLVLGKAHESSADYLDSCRKKRNETEYNLAGKISSEEVLELIEFCNELKIEVIDWLKKNHKELTE